MSKLKLDLNHVKEFITAQSESTKFYIGCDSEIKKKNGKWYADYVSVVVIHKDGNKGCKVFGKVETEEIYQVGKNKQNLRLMTEVYKASELYLELAEQIGDRYLEIHLDINPDERYDSSVVLSQAVGYIKGLCGLDPKVKPEAFAASYAADRFVRDSHKNKLYPFVEAA